MSTEEHKNSEERFEVSYRLPTPPPPGAVPLTAGQAEERLLAEVKKGAEAGNPIKAMWDLANFYKATYQVEKAEKAVRDLLARVPDIENKAYLILSLGQLAEMSKDFDLAVRFYLQGVSMEPCAQFTWYYLHNNLGYSLNQLGRFEEGERYCRRAIEITAKPQNAHKNLGLALQGQGKYAEAARCFVIATQANASDERSANHLEELIQQHPELEFEFGPLLQKCKAAVEGVRLEIRKHLQPPRTELPDK
ncbi:MAG TPA: tetratricopeptide repeat protein [Verrucomicrobiae bacterium]|nr:tetratricopeptide repeat protein [Verrucomicrobiae bacterium]